MDTSLPAEANNRFAGYWRLRLLSTGCPGELVSFLRQIIQHVQHLLKAVSRQPPPASQYQRSATSGAHACQQPEDSGRDPPARHPVVSSIKVMCVFTRNMHRRVVGCTRLPSRVPAFSGIIGTFSIVKRGYHSHSLLPFPNWQGQPC